MTTPEKASSWEAKCETQHWHLYSGHTREEKFKRPQHPILNIKGEELEDFSSLSRKHNGGKGALHV